MNKPIKVSSELLPQPLSKTLRSVDTAMGRARVFKHLKQQPFPQYKADPKRPGGLIRIEANGKCTAGRFVNRKFEPVKQKSK